MKTLSAIAIGALLLFPARVYSQKDGSNVLATESLVGKSAPQFSGTSLMGTEWNNEAIKGKVVLLNFWFIGCPPCMKEIKHFNELHSAYQNDDFVLLSIAPQVKDDLMLFNDTTKTSMPATLRDYFKAEPIEYDVIPACDKKRHKDPNKVGVECDHISKDFYVAGYPTTFIIDKAGVVRHVQSGFSDVDEGGETIMGKYKEIIDQLLAE